jgi:hypothetical protein
MPRPWLGSSSPRVSTSTSRRPRWLGTSLSWRTPCACCRKNVGCCDGQCSFCDATPTKYLEDLTCPSLRYLTFQVDDTRLLSPQLALPYLFQSIIATGYCHSQPSTPQNYPPCSTTSTSPGPQALPPRTSKKPSALPNT